MNWDAQISINTQSEKFHYRNHQSCLLQLLSFLDARRTRGILLLMDTASPKTAPEMATPTTSVPCSLQAEPLESPSTHWPSPWVQRPGVPRQKVLQNPWSLSLPSWRPDQLCLETDLPSHPCWHELLRRLLRADLDWNFSPKPSLQPLQMEPLRGYSAPTPQILQHRWGLAPRISLPDGLLQSYNLEISRLLEEGTERNRRQDDSTLDETAPSSSSEKVDYLRWEAEEDRWWFWELWSCWLSYCYWECYLMMLLYY